MKIAILTALSLGGAFAATRDLSTRYAPEVALRVETSASFQIETTAMEILRDGEPMEGRGGGPGGGSKGTHSSVVVDRYVECGAGAPTLVRRSFEAVEGETERSVRGEPMAQSIDSPFQGVTLELSSDEEGEVSAEVLEGDAPADEALELLRPTLALDALLPSEEVEAGQSWDLEPEAIAHALGLDLARHLHPRPEPEGGRGGGGEGGRGGRGGRRGGGGGGSVPQLLASAEWTGTASLRDGLEELDGVECAVIEIELEASSENDDGEGRSSSLTVELEGLLHVATGERRPLLFELEGSIESEQDTERERQGSLMEVHRESEGTYTLRVSVSETPFEES